MDDTASTTAAPDCEMATARFAVPNAAQESRRRRICRADSVLGAPGAQTAGPRAVGHAPDAEACVQDGRRSGEPLPHVRHTAGRVDYASRFIKTCPTGYARRGQQPLCKRFRDRSGAGELVGASRDRRIRLVEGPSAWCGWPIEPDEPGVAGRRSTPLPSVPVLHLQRRRHVGEAAVVHGIHLEIGRC